MREFMKVHREFLLLMIIVTLITSSIIMGIGIKELEDSNNHMESVIVEVKENNIRLEREIKVLTEKNESLKEELNIVLDNNNEYLEEIEDLKSKIKQLGVEKSKLISNNKASKPTPNRSISGSRNLGTFESTAYCACTKCCGPNAKGITRTGTKVTAGRTIAVDPNVIPLGSKVYIEGVGERIAEDSGSAVKGKIVDIYMKNHSSALKWGRRKVNVRIIE